MWREVKDPERGPEKPIRKQQGPAMLDLDSGRPFNHMLVQRAAQQSTPQGMTFAILEPCFLHGASRHRTAKQGQNKTLVVYYGAQMILAAPICRPLKASAPTSLTRT